MRTLSVAVVAGCLGASASVAHAATFMVTNTNDSGAGSLRDAIAQANNANDADTITFTVAGPINLQSALPAITNPLTITGPGAANLTVRRDAIDLFRIFNVAAAVEISGLTISDGACPGLDPGGGIRVGQGASLTLTDSVVSNNTCTLGGAGIYALAPVTITRTTFTGNSGASAFYFSITVPTTTVTVTESTFATNVATAIRFSTTDSTLVLDRSTISGNTSATGVGGVSLQGGTATITSSTFSGNSGLQSGDLWTFSSGVTFNLTNVTLAGSSSPSVLADHAATVNLRNTIIAGTGARCTISGGGVIASGGHNLSSDGTCNLGEASDKPSTDPMLDALASYGGPTQTRRLQPGSPALNAGDGANVAATDQRGLSRGAFAAVDIGAFEAQGPGAPTIGAATAGNAQAEIAFTAPTSTGDGPITEHEVTCNPGAIAATGAASPVTVMGLDNGTEYACSVVAKNGYGAGPASGTVAVTPTDPDAGVADAGADADAGTSPDAATPDASAPVADAGTPRADGGGPSPGPDSGTFDAGAGPSIGGGTSDDDCGCGVVGLSGGGLYHLVALGSLIGVGFARRRRRAQR